MIQIMEKGLERMQDFMNQTSKWSDKTFDNGDFNRGRALPISYHLQKESKELTESLDKYFNENTAINFADAKEELADCLTLVLDCATHFGCNADELITACYNKLEKNKNRSWGKPDKNGVVEHIK
jgi:NTP pyrophosphatase (non-canonical NTP hydrolase)